MAAADLVIHSAVLWSDGGRLPSDALAVAGGHIVAIGSSEEILAEFSAARVVDAAGRLVTPSFADAHIHAMFAGVESLRCDLTGSADAAECLSRIASYAQTHPDLPWIVGAGWEMPFFEGGTPRREDLDRIVPDRPVYLLNRDHHGAWVNTAALAAAGIDDSTPDPQDGRIERDPDGSASGTLHEGAAELVGAVAPETTVEECRRGVLAAQETLLALGITAWQEAIIGEYAGYPDGGDVYAELISSGELRARVSGALWVRRGIGPDDAEAVVADFVDRREHLASGGFAAVAAKIMVDGIAENETAAMNEPYLSCSHGTGIAHFSRETLTGLVPRLNAAGFDLHAHAIGDRAVRYALDAVEAVDPAVRAGRRNHIAHLQVIDPADVPRFAELGVVANAQPLWACNEDQMTELTVPILGPERSAWQYPFASLLRSGARVGCGSDWPVSTPDPWDCLHVAVTRRPPGEPEVEPLLPAEALTLDEVLLAYTRGAHDLVGSPAGSLAVGAPADLAMADRNPFESDPLDLHETSTCLTVLAGAVVHPPPA